jgi:hypothetical protein
MRDSVNDHLGPVRRTRRDQEKGYSEAKCDEECAELSWRQAAATALKRERETYLMHATF